MNTVTSKQLVTYPNGAKAMLIFKPNREKAIIEFYVPSKKYRDYMEELKAQREKLLAPKKYPRRVPVSTLSYHEHHANKLIMDMVKAGLMDPSYDDIIFDIDFDTPVVLTQDQIDKGNDVLKLTPIWPQATIG